MATQILMPKFGLSMEEGTIAGWLVKEGDEIKKGQAIAEINSEKLTNNAESEQDGVLLKILVQEDDTVACGVPIAVMGEAGEDISSLTGSNAAEASVIDTDTQSNTESGAVLPDDVHLVPMPKFGLSMEEGTIAGWLVKEGDTVSKGQAIAEINSEKLTNNAESEFDGVLLKILLNEDETAACGEAIAIIGPADSDISGITMDGTKSLPPAETVSASCEAASSPAASANVNITPRAKKYAEENGLSYAHIKGTGIGGAITIDDVKKNGRPAVSEGTAAAVPSADVKITPKAQKYADEHKLAYAHIIGSGIGGAITIDDVKKNGRPAAEASPEKKSQAEPSKAAAGVEQVKAGVQPGDTVTAMSQMQLAISKGMYSSLQGTAQTTIAAEVNVENLTKVYKSLKDKYAAAGVKLSYTALLVKAAAMAIENHETVRTQYVDEKHIKIVSKIDIGIAVDIPGGLIVPVIRDANLKDLRNICRDLADISSRAKENKLTENDLGGAVTTITNLGMCGITYFTPVLNSPESTILGAGAIIEKPVIRDGGIFVEHVMNLSLTHDHRISNGAPCARYLSEICNNLQDFKWM